MVYRWRLIFAALVSVALLSFGAASAVAAPSPHVAAKPVSMAPLASQGGGGCSWQYHFTVSTLSAGATAKIWLTNSTCGSGRPHMRAILACTLRSTVLVYGAWVVEGATSTAKCSSTTVPSYLNEQVQFANGSTATYRDWTR